MVTCYLRSLIRRELLILVVFLTTSCVSGGGVQNWKVLKSPNYEVYYPPDNQFRARKMMYHLEKNREAVNKITGSDEREGKRQVVVVLEDAGLAPGGFANPISERISVFSAHPRTGSVLSDFRHYDRMVTVHELTHIRQDTNVYGTSRALTTIFGNHFSPNFYSPPWLSEGIATYAESQSSEQEGRLNEGFFNAVVAGKASAGELPTIHEMTYLHNIYPRGHFYVFGSSFITYLVEEYGRDSTAEFISAYSTYFWVPLYNFLIPRANLVPAGGLDRAAEHVFGLPFEHLYLEWRGHLRQKYKNWSIDGEPVVETNRGVLSNLTEANGKLYYFRREVQSVFPYQYRRITHLAEYDPETGEEQIHLSLRAEDVGRVQVVGDSLYFATRELEYGFQNFTFLGWGSAATVKRYNLSSGEVDELIQGQIRDFVVRSGEDIFYAKERNDQYGSELWTYQNGHHRKVGTVDELISELHRYNNQIIAVSKKSGGTWDITRLNTDPLQLQALIASKYPEKLVTISGNSLYYTANYDGNLAVYHKEMDTGRVERMTEGGYAVEGVKAGDQFYFLSGVVDGMGLYRKNRAPAPFAPPETRRQEDAVNLDELEVAVTEKNALMENFSELIPPDRRFLPVLADTEDALGMNRFVIDFSSNDVEALWNTRMFRPLSISLLSRREFDDDETDTVLNVAYPLYRSPQSGLSAITADVETDFDEVIPGAQIRFDLTNHRLSLRQQYKLEDDREEESFNSVLTYNYWLHRGNIGLLAGLSEGFEHRNRNRTFEIEGVDDEARRKRLSVDYTRKLFEWRDGIWNPNLFAGDLYAGPFVDWIERAEREKLSGGVQVHLESGVANYQLVPTIGTAISEDNEKKIFAGLRFAF